ncbi:hypothetical protein QBC43DRAFT_351735, partial [Cladorrhinum sp. PSN259]
MCDLSPESPTPFCGPAEGTRVRTGDTVDIIWSARFFATSPTSLPRRIRIQADYFFANNNTRTGNGFTSLVISPASGRFTWRPLERDLPTGINTITAAIFIAEPFTDSDGNGTTLEGNDRFPGPRLSITRGARRNEGPSAGPAGTGTGGTIANSNPNRGNNMGAIGSGGPNPLAIALPIIFGVVTLVIMVGFVMWRKRHPGWSLRETVVKGVPGLLRRRMGPRAGGRIAPSTAGQPKIRGQDIKVVTTDIDQLRMNAMYLVGSGGGGGGGRSEGERNVFREEMMRQERSMV